MTETPQNFAESPDALPDAATLAALDALSEILETVRLRGQAVTRRSTESGIPVRVPPGKRVLHILERGTAEIRVDGETGGTTAHSGDMVVLARGDGHTVTPVGGAARWVTGSFLVDEPQAAPLLSVLAPAIHIEAAGPSRDWLPLSLNLLLVEVTHPRPGAAAMISRILDLLFIHALRAWSTDTAAPGWLTAALDPALAPVLTAVHHSPAAPWSVSDLAALASMSRTTFTDRFTRRLGQPPAAYLTGQRLARAATLLRTSTIPIATVAHQVGYDSEAAFSRAFHRHYGTPPLRYRKGENPASP
ncbi:AraC family transcriptional regulator [Nocardia tengchongensis]|uniref:AraC family transcriptional regulator n=1 Tax=Nocardia tengchongensis TaxID=2055889 RepID=UPI0036492446